VTYSSVFLLKGLTLSVEGLSVHFFCPPPVACVLLLCLCCFGSLSDRVIFLNFFPGICPQLPFSLPPLYFFQRKICSNSLRAYSKCPSPLTNFPPNLLTAFQIPPPPFFHDHSCEAKVRFFRLFLFFPPGIFTSGGGLLFFPLPLLSVLLLFPLGCFVRCGPLTFYPSPSFSFRFYWSFFPLPLSVIM